MDKVILAKIDLLLEELNKQINDIQVFCRILIAVPLIFSFGIMVMKPFIPILNLILVVVVMLSVSILFFYKSKKLKKLRSLRRLVLRYRSNIVNINNNFYTEKAYNNILNNIREEFYKAMHNVFKNIDVDEIRSSNEQDYVKLILSDY